MLNVQTWIADANDGLLYQQLKGAGYTNASIEHTLGGAPDPTLPVLVTVYLANDADQVMQDAAMALVKAHDPTQMSAAQQAAAQEQKAQITLKGELQTLQTRLQNFNGDVGALAADLAVIVGVILGLQ